MPMGLHIRYRIIVVKIDKNYKKKWNGFKIHIITLNQRTFFLCVKLKKVTFGRTVSVSTNLVSLCINNYFGEKKYFSIAVFSWEEPDL